MCISLIVDHEAYIAINCNFENIEFVTQHPSNRDKIKHVTIKTRRHLE